MKKMSAQSVVADEKKTPVLYVPRWHTQVELKINKIDDRALWGNCTFSVRIMISHQHVGVGTQVFLRRSKAQNLKMQLRL